MKAAGYSSTAAPFLAFDHGASDLFPSRGRYEKAVCRHCGSRFTYQRTRKHRLFCSFRCRKASSHQRINGRRSERARALRRAPRYCACGVVFFAESDRGGVPRFCSGCRLLRHHGIPTPEVIMIPAARASSALDKRPEAPTPTMLAALVAAADAPIYEGEGIALSTIRRLVKANLGAHAQIRGVSASVRGRSVEGCPRWRFTINTRGRAWLANEAERGALPPSIRKCTNEPRKPTPVVDPRQTGLFGGRP